MSDRVITLESKAYRALLAAAMQSLYEGAGPTNSIQDYDLKYRLDIQRAPIEYVRGIAWAMNLIPHTTIIDESFERWAVGHYWRFFTERDQISVGILYAEGMKSVADIYPTNNNTRLYVCFSPSPYVDLNSTELQVEIINVLEWLYPHFRKAIDFSVCISYSFNLYMNIGYKPAEMYIGSIAFDDGPRLEQ